MPGFSSPVYCYHESRWAPTKSRTLEKACTASLIFTLNKSSPKISLWPVKSSGASEKASSSTKLQFQFTSGFLYEDTWVITSVYKEMMDFQRAQTTKYSPRLGNPFFPRYPWGSVIIFIRTVKRSTSFRRTFIFKKRKTSCKRFILCTESSLLR